MKGEEEQLKNVTKIFSSYLKEGNDELTLEDFKELVPSKNVSYHCILFWMMVTSNYFMFDTVN